MLYQTESVPSSEEAASKIDAMGYCDAQKPDAVPGSAAGRAGQSCQEDHSSPITPINKDSW